MTIPAAQDDSILSLDQLQPVIEFHGPIVVHNMCCAVYYHLPAVYNKEHGVFLPSLEAQRDGFTLIRIKNKFIRKLLNWFIGVR